MEFLSSGLKPVLPISSAKMSPVKTRLPAWVWILVALGFCFALGSGLQMQRNQHGVDDFDQFYVGARLVFSGHLYDLPAQLELQRETVGVERPAVSSSRLPFYYAMLWPLGRLQYATARTLWFGLMILAAVGFVLVYPMGGRVPLRDRRGSVSGFDGGRWVLAAAVLSSLPLFAATLGQRQDIALLLLILGVSLRLRALGYETAAGLVLALLAIKIHLFLLVPVALLMRREWRMTFGLAGGGVALLGFSFAAAGRGWVREYLALISNPGVISDPAGKPNLHGVVAAWSHAGAWEAVLSIAVVVAVVVVAGRSGFEIAFSAGMLGSFLVSNHAYLHDCAVLIPGLVEIAGRKSRRQPARPLKITRVEDPEPTASFGRGSWSGSEDIGRGAAWGLAVTLLTPFPYFLPPLLIHIREGVGPAVLIGATLLALIPTVKGENKA